MKVWCRRETDHVGGDAPRTLIQACLKPWPLIEPALDLSSKKIDIQANIEGRGHVVTTKSGDVG